MRLLRFMARKSLLALGYPRLETLHPDPELGIHAVGAVRARMAPDLPACQFFYPVDDGTEDSTIAKNNNTKRKQKRKRRRGKEKIPYYRPEAVDGLLDFLNGFADGIMQMLQEKSHPLSGHYASDPLGLDASASTKFPLVVFSHGLSGTMEMYTQLCSQIASTGCVVVALEHEDGSASYAEKQLCADDGASSVQVIPYKRPDMKFYGSYSRETVLDFRTPMLEQRVEEVRQICNAFAQDGERRETFPSDHNQLMQKILSVTDASQLHLVGHSFGGATQLLAAQTWETETLQQNEAQREVASVPAMAILAAANSSDASGFDVAYERAPTAVAQPELEASSEASLPPPSPLSITVYDAWNFALSDKVLQTGLGNANGNGNADSASTSTPNVEILSVLSDEWATHSPEREQTLEFLRNCQDSNVRSCVAKNAVHQSVSDTEAYLPSIAARAIRNRGKGEGRHQTIRAIASEVAKLARGRTGKNRQTAEDDDVVPVLEPFPLQ